MTFTIAALLAASVVVGQSGAVVPTLSIPNQVLKTAVHWELTFAVYNGTGRELHLLAPHNSLYMQGSREFEILDSLGRQLVSRFNGEIALPMQAVFWYPLVKPGETFSRTYPTVDRFFGTAPIYDPSCDSLATCPTVPSFPAMTFRARWRLRDIGADLDVVPPLDDPSKVWKGEVWSNTLIIQTTEKEPVKVGLNVDPDTLNFKSEGKWITAYLSASREADLVASKVKFQGTIVADKVEWDQGPGAGGQWMIKFPRSLVIDLLKDIRGWELDGYMKVFVSAESGGKMFWGDDKIRILEVPGNAAPPVPPQGPPSTPPGQDKKKSSRR